MNHEGNAFRYYGGGSKDVAKFVLAFSLGPRLSYVTHARRRSNRIKVSPLLTIMPRHAIVLFFIMCDSTN